MGAGCLPRKRRRCCLFFLLLAVAVGAGGVPHRFAGPSSDMIRKAAASDLPVYLYFGEPGGRFLTGEPVAVENPGDDLRYCQRIVEALIGGPDGDLIPTLPEQTKLRGVYLDRQTAYVDLSRAVVELHPGGVRSELLTVYSIVNTLVLNLDDIERVKILVEGNEAETLAGHIAIDSPLTAQMLLVR